MNPARELPEDRAAARQGVVSRSAQLVAAHRTFGTGVLYAAVIVAIVAFTTKLY